MAATTTGQPASIRLDADRGDRLLLGAAWVFTIAVVLHGLDHGHRGVDTVALDVFWIGTAAITIEIAVVALIAQRHRVAPLASVAVGGSLALGYVVVHFLPHRGWLSDSLVSADDVSMLTWAAASLEVVAAVAVGLLGLVVLRQRGGLVSATEPHANERTARAGLLHPATLVMIAGNTVILAIALGQLLA